MGQLFAKSLHKSWDPESLGISLLIISDTHGQHRRLDLSSCGEVDYLIHAGDFTHFGSREDAEDFNKWLGELGEKKLYKHCLVVEGNHEANAPWKNEAHKILSNATFLRNDSIVIDGVTIFGKAFFWNMKTKNPHDETIPRDTDILIAHNPPKGYVDAGSGTPAKSFGCPSSAEMVADIRPRVYVCGHVHSARGTQKHGSVLFVNGSNVLEKKSEASSAAEGGDRVDATKGAIRGKGQLGERRYNMLDKGKPIIVEI